MPDAEWLGKHVPRDIRFGLRPLVPENAWARCRFLSLLLDIVHWEGAAIELFFK